MKRLVSCFTALLIMATIVTPVSAKEDHQVSLDKITEFTNEAIVNGVFPGATVLVKKGDTILYHESFGSIMVSDMGVPVENPKPMKNTTLYDLASVTKVMATTQGIMVLYDQGKIDLDAPVQTYLSEFGQNGKESVTVRQLLTHTSGLTPWKPTFLYGNTRAQELEYINKLPLENAPGTKFAYSDFSFMTLAFIIESVTGMPIEAYLNQEVYQPLGMDRTTFLPKQNGFTNDDIAATSWGNPYEKRMVDEENYPGFGYDCTDDVEAFKAFTGWREYTLIGEVNDGNAGMANAGVAGHAGLFSTAEDLSILGSAMLHGGIADNGYQLYSAETISEFTKPQAFGRGLGFQVNGGSETSGYVGKYASDAVFSHAGFTGTHATFDSDYDLQVIILTNKMNNGTNEKGSYASPYPYARNVMNYIYETLDEDIAVVNKDELKTAIDNVESFAQSDYTIESWSNLQAVLNKSKLVLVNDKAIQQEVDTAISSLDSGINALVKIEITQPLQIELLKNTIAHAKAVDPAKYTEESYNAMLHELTYAEELISDLENKEITQDTIDACTQSLQSKIDALKEKTELVKEKKETPTTGIQIPNLLLPLILSGSTLYFITRKRLAKKIDR